MQDKIYYYSNLDIDVNGSTMPLIIWGIYVGIMLGVLGSILCRIYSNRLIQALLKNGCCTADSSKTLDALGLRKQWLVLHMLKEDSALRRYVLASGDIYLPVKAGKLKKFWYEKFLRSEIPTKIDWDRAKFYLPEEKRIGAELRFQVEGHPIRNFIFAAIALFAVALFINFALPELLQMLDNFITSVQPESKFL